MKERGQAAVTDALYFLLIITSLCIFLFSFANNYGVSISRQIVQQYNADYAVSALRTILYSSTPRDPNESLYDVGVEIDHLLAYIKEDYADDEKLDQETMVVLAKGINAIMAPLAENYDYIFSISIPTEGSFVFVFFHLSNFEKTTTGHITTYKPKTPTHTDFFCGIKAGGGNTMNRNAIKNLTAKVGDTYDASAKINLVKESGATFRAQAELIMWNAVDAGESAYYKSSQEGWCCIEAGQPFSSSLC